MSWGILICCFVEPWAQATRRVLGLMGPIGTPMELRQAQALELAVR